MKIERIQHGSPAYFATLDLRRRVLREPLGLEYSEADLAAEDSDYHLVAFDNEAPVGSLLLRANAEGIAMRQVCVDPDYQGQGVGRLLVEASEAWSAELGYAEIHLHARVTAIPFYERLGYVAEGPVFTEVTIPHRQMTKRLGQT